MLPSQPEILEVGPGTGQATKDLLARGASVLAIEIGPAMAAKLRSNLPSDRLNVGVGDFEAMESWPVRLTPCFRPPPITGSLDRRRPSARSDPASRGIMAIVDLIQVDSPDDAGFFAAAQPIYERYGQGHAGPPAPTRGDVDPAIRSVLHRSSFRLRRRPPVRLEPDVQRLGLPNPDALVLGDSG